MVYLLSPFIHPRVFRFLHLFEINKQKNEHEDFFIIHRKHVDIPICVVEYSARRVSGIYASVFFHFLHLFEIKNKKKEHEDLNIVIHKKHVDLPICVIEAVERVSAVGRHLHIHEFFNFSTYLK